ncbi:hypothetical protein [Flavobacterium sp.]|uniref:hypothetical protein n=1 Tax=Flavobacterium sp. TaxID=239 RepID=UPI0039E597CE
MTVTNFNELWQSNQPNIPDPQEIIAKALKVQRNTRRKTLFGNALLAATLAFIIFIVLHYDPKMPTTKLGTLIVVIAIVMQIIASGKLIPMTRKTDATSSTADFLKQMLQIQQKQLYLQTTIMSLYFVMLSGGIFLYMYEYAVRMGALGFGLTYGLTALWIALSWFYIRPRTIRKQNGALNEVIENLQKMNRQFAEEQ